MLFNLISTTALLLFLAAGLYAQKDFKGELLL
jgi:hypothetical protein